MSDQMLIRIQPEVKNKLYNFAKLEGKNASLLIRELIEKYIEEHDISAYIDDLWGRINKKLKAEKVRVSDVARVIKETRKK